MVELGSSRLFPSGRGLLGRMPGARGRPAASAGCEPAPGLRRRIPARAHRGALARWACLAAVALLSVASAHAQVIGSRIWPARDYTRLTLESIAELKYQVFAVKDPERLVVDLESEMTSPLVELDGKVMADDPYIKGLRVARNRPGVVRLVLDLKSEVKPQVFTLMPVGEYGHGLGGGGIRAWGGTEHLPRGGRQSARRADRAGREAQAAATGPDGAACHH